MDHQRHARARAETWGWEPIAAQADRWAASGVVGLAEDAVCEAEGPDWTSAWDTAAALVPLDVRTSCRAALRLYRLAAARLEAHFTSAERPVIATARGVAEAAGG